MYHVSTFPNNFVPMTFSKNEDADSLEFQEDNLFHNLGEEKLILWNIFCNKHLGLYVLVYGLSNLDRVLVIVLFNCPFLSQIALAAYLLAVYMEIVDANAFRHIRWKAKSV